MTRGGKGRGRMASPRMREARGTEALGKMVSEK